MKKLVNRLYYQLPNYKKVNFKAYTNSFQGCPGGDAQPERKKPSHVQGHVNRAEEFLKDAQLNYLSFVKSG